MARRMYFVLSLVAIMQGGLSSAGVTQDISARLRPLEALAVVCQGTRPACLAQNPEAREERGGSSIKLAAIGTQQAPICGPKGHRKPWGFVCSPIGRCNGHGVCCPADDTACLGPPPR
jgi:hypothetical protein